MAGEKILVVDDEAVTLELLSHFLGKEGFQVFLADSGVFALQTIDREEPDLILLDILLPDLDGMEVLRQLRQKTDVPVIFITAKTDSLDVALGLGLGGDDYVMKPFIPVEVVARVKAHLRRYFQRSMFREGELRPVLNYPGLRIDTRMRTVEVRGRAVALTTKEFDILVLLARNPHRYFTS